MRIYLLYIMNTTDRYQNGMIYKLVSNCTDGIYIGSTCMPLSKRKNIHKNNYKRWKNGKFNYVTSFDLYDIGDVDIVLIEQYPCNSKMELHARERHYIESMDCMNKNVPCRTKKQYYQDNQDKIKEQVKQYRKANKDKIKDKKKEYYDKNKNQINEKINCECGGRYTKAHKSRHLKSARHQNHIKQT